MQQAAASMEKFADILLKMYRDQHLADTAHYKELEKTVKQGKVKYSATYMSFLKEAKETKTDQIQKISNAFNLRHPNATEEEKSANLITKVYQIMSLEDLVKNDLDKSPTHLLLEKELRSFAATLMTLWFGLFNSLFVLHKQLAKTYCQLHDTNKRERLLQQIIGSKEVDPELGAYNREDVGTMHRTIARTKRSSGFFKQLLEFDSQKVEDEKYYLKADLIPIIFEETFLRFENAEEIMQMNTGDKQESKTGFTAGRYGLPRWESVWK